MKTPLWAPEIIDADAIALFNAADDRPRKLQRGKLLHKSEECKKNRHGIRCSSSHCNCECHSLKP